MVFVRLKMCSSRQASTEDDNSKNTNRIGWTKIMLLAGVATTLGSSLPVGYNIGVINSPAQIIKSFCNESMYTRYDLKMSATELDVLWSAIVSVFLVGGMTGSLTGSWLADRIGRKGAIIVSSVLSTVSAVLFFATYSANSVEMLIAGRLIIGLASGLITGTIPMYLTEIAPLHLRGSMGVLCPLGVTVGVLLGQIMGLRQILGTEELWPYLLSFYVVLVILSAFAIPVLPESPKYLYVIKNEPLVALKELSKIRGIPQDELQNEIEELRLSQERDEEAGASWNLRTVIADKSFMLPLLLVCSVQAGQQFSGINAVFYYSVSIFESAGLSEQSSQLATIGAGGVNLMMAIIAIPVMQRVKRRTILQISCLTAAICLLILSLSITYIKSYSWMPYICIVAVLSYVLFYGLGLGPIPYFIGSELFEVGPRPSAMALGSMANWGGNFVIGMSFTSLQSALGAGSFVIFAAITVALLVFVRVYMPETLNRDVSDVAKIMTKGFRSRPLDSPVDSMDTETITIGDNSKAAGVV